MNGADETSVSASDRGTTGRAVTVPLWWWLVLLAIVGGIAYLVKTTWFPSQAPFHELLEDLRERGEPVDPHEFIPAAIPEDENGAALLLEALAWVERTHGADWKERHTGVWDQTVVHPWYENAPPERVTELTALLDTFGPLLERVREGLARPAVRFDSVGLRPNGLIDSADVKPVQELGLILDALETAARSRAVRMDALQAHLEIPLRWVRFGQLHEHVAIAVFANACLALRSGISSGRIDAVEARARLDELLRTEWCVRIPRVVREERAAELYAWSEGVEGRGYLAHRPWNIRFVGAFYGTGGAWMAGHPDGPLDLSQVVDRVAQIDFRAERDDSPAFELAVGEVENRPFLVLALPLLLEYAQRLDATCALLRVGLAVAEHRKKTGAWPDSLDELAPLFRDGVPNDPFSAGPFVYERTEDGGVRLASIGSKEQRQSHDPEGAVRDVGLVWELPGR